MVAALQPFWEPFIFCPGAGFCDRWKAEQPHPLQHVEYMGWYLTHTVLGPSAALGAAMHSLPAEKICRPMLECQEAKIMHGYFPAGSGRQTSLGVLHHLSIQFQFTSYVKVFTDASVSWCQVLLVLQDFAPIIQGKHVLVRTDRRTFTGRAESVPPY